MNPKCICCILLSIAVIAFSTVTVFAEESSVVIEATTTLDNTPDFMISIPTVIPMEDIQRTAEPSVKSKTFSVKLNAAEELDDQQVEVFVSAPDDQFALYCDVYRLPYQLFNQASGGAPLESGDLFAIFTQNGEVTGRVEVDEMNIPATGTYSGSLQFLVTVREKSS